MPYLSFFCLVNFVAFKHAQDIGVQANLNTDLLKELKSMWIYFCMSQIEQTLVL